MCIYFDKKKKVLKLQEDGTSHIFSAIYHHDTS
jgi:hypothetical protein